MELEYGAFSIGKKGRPNEDRYRLLGNKVPLVSRSGRGQLFAVFDGIGGSPKGRDAAQAMCDSLIQFYKIAIEAPIDATRIFSLLATANMEIYNWGFRTGTTRPLGGCAGTIAWFYEDQLWIFHSGDTVGYLIKGDGINPLTREHGEGNYISSYFGQGEKIIIDSFSFPIDEGDILVLATDGVTKVMSSESIAASVNQWIIRSPDMAAQQLCEMALQKGSTDDITAVVVEIVDLS
jgi:serine/threonine protein phosphatase PrpC